MYSDEQEIRAHFKTLTNEDIANSIYLIGVDLDTIDIDSLLDKVYSLYEEVNTLRRMINGGFKPEGDDPVLLPKDPRVQAGIMDDLSRKQSALIKILDNDKVYYAFWGYRQKDTNEKQSGF